MIVPLSSDACQYKKCGFRQICTMNRYDEPQCVCPRQCKNSKGKPVCGYKNGKQYNNDCELYRHECKDGAEIGLMQGPCKSKSICLSRYYYPIHCQSQINCIYYPLSHNSQSNANFSFQFIANYLWHRYTITVTLTKTCTTK